VARVHLYLVRGARGCGSGDHWRSNFGLGVIARIQNRPGDRHRVQSGSLGGTRALPLGRRSNNHVENRIRPVALGRYKCIFAGSLRAGQRAANVMSLIQSAKLNGHDPYRYLKDVLERLSTQPASRLEELLPHRWQLRT
jgi:hypothetical protein